MELFLKSYVFCDLLHFISILTIYIRNIRWVLVRWHGAGTSHNLNGTCRLQYKLLQLQKGDTALRWSILVYSQISYSPYSCGLQTMNCKISCSAVVRYFIRLIFISVIQSFDRSRVLSSSADRIWRGECRLEKCKSLMINVFEYHPPPSLVRPWTQEINSSIWFSHDDNW